MNRLILLAAAVLIVAGPVVVMVGGGLGIGVPLFAVGLILLGVNSLMEGREKSVALVVILTGVAIVAAYLLRLLLLAG